MGFLLTASRHLSMGGSEITYTRLALQYKLRYVQNLRETISTATLASRRAAVTKALVLAFDEVG